MFTWNIKSLTSSYRYKSWDIHRRFRKLFYKKTRAAYRNGVNPVWRRSESLGMSFKLIIKHLHQWYCNMCIIFWVIEKEEKINKKDVAHEKNLVVRSFVVWNGEQSLNWTKDRIFCRVLLKKNCCFKFLRREVVMRKHYCGPDLQHKVKQSYRLEYCSPWHTLLVGFID